MKVRTTFNVSLERDGEQPVIFTFKTPRLNEIHKDNLLYKRMKSEDPGAVTEARIEMVLSIVNRCVSVQGLYDEAGNELSPSDVGDLPASIVAALLEAYQKGSAEAVNEGNEKGVALSESASA